MGFLVEKIRQLPYMFFWKLQLYLFIVNFNFMMSIQLIVLFLFVCLLLGMIQYFYIKNRSLKLDHLQRTQIISQAVLVHKTQIKFREKGLLNYNFLKYNLDESLKVQSEIKLI